MTDNRLGGAELEYMTKYKKLKIIKFANNLVKEISEIAVLKDLEHLMSIDLSENPVCQVEGYKEKMFEIFPKLEVTQPF